MRDHGTRRSGGRPSLRACAAALLAGIVACLGPAHAGAQPGSAPAVRLAPHHEIVTLLAPHAVRSRASADGRRIGLVAPRRPITGARTVLPVLATTRDARGRTWLRVRLPGRVLGRRPPPRTGWISTPRTRRSATRWHIVVDLDGRRVIAYHDGRRVRTFGSIVGERSTPTPRGRHFVEEGVRLPAGRAGAPFALALSARSSVLQEFDGGPGQIALHGLRGLSGELGTAASHGCVRLADAPITWLARRVGPGVPVTIV